MNVSRRSFTTSASALLATAALVRSSRAQGFPSKPFRVIVPFSAGSATDVVPRLVFDALGKDFNQTIIVDNRPGAGGTIGTGAVARAEPDGYTLLATASAHTNIPTLFPNAPFDTVKDFAGVTPLGSLPQVLVVAPGSPHQTLRSLVEAAKARPGSVSYASAGIGSGSHFAAERLRLSAGFEGTHVPYKGGPEAIADTMTGRVDFFFCPLALCQALIADNRLRPLAVSSPKRAKALPNVPTTLEEGYPDSDYTFWVGVYAPAKTPADIVARLHDAILKVLGAPDTGDKLAKMGVDPMPMSPGEFDAMVKREVEANAKVIRAAGIKGE
jgi:tripartite-type tricarboxylate transporter receptor subunit TctC